jgi:F-type H+-transporting ATPase subunit delta
MSHSIEEYAQALHLALQESKPEDADAIVDNLLGLLKSDNQLELYSAIVERLSEIMAGQESIKQVEATFANKLSSNQKILEEINTLVGPTLEVRSHEDNELVGGMVLRVDDTLVDASIKGQLKRLQDSLVE